MFRQIVFGFALLLLCTGVAGAESLDSKSSRAMSCNKPSERAVASSDGAACMSKEQFFDKSLEEGLAQFSNESQLDPENSSRPCWNIYFVCWYECHSSLNGCMECCEFGFCGLTPWACWMTDDVSMA